MGIPIRTFRNTTLVYFSDFIFQKNNTQHIYDFEGLRNIKGEFL